MTTVNLQRQEMIISGVTTKDRTVVGQEISNNNSPGRTFERQEVSKSGIATMGRLTSDQKGHVGTTLPERSAGNSLFNYGIRYACVNTGTWYQVPDHTCHMPVLPVVVLLHGN